MFKTLYVDLTPTGRQTITRVEVGTLTTKKTVKTGVVQQPELVARASHRLRISLRLDSYGEQCYARVERWDGDRWHEVVNTPHALMALVTHKVNPYSPIAPAAPAWILDRATLLEKAKAVLA